MTDGSKLSKQSAESSFKPCPGILVNENIIINNRRIFVIELFILLWIRLWIKLMDWWVGRWDGWIGDGGKVKDQG